MGGARIFEVLEDFARVKSWDLVSGFSNGQPRLWYCQRLGICAPGSNVHSIPLGGAEELHAREVTSAPDGVLPAPGAAMRYFADRGRLMFLAFRVNPQPSES